MARYGDGDPADDAGGTWWEDERGGGPSRAPGIGGAIARALQSVLPPRGTFAGFKPMLRTERAIGATSVVLPADDTLRALIDLVGDDELGDVVTVSFDVIPPPADTFAGGEIRRLRARIQWGTGGSQHEAEIDVRKGTQISVPASFLRVSVANEGAVITPQVRASVGHLPRGARSPATRTRYITAIVGGATATHDVPAFASAITVLRTPSSAAFLVEMLDSNGTEIAAVPVAANQQVPNQFPLPNDINQVRINATNNITLARAVYDLAL